MGDDGWREDRQDQFFYEFNLDEAVSAISPYLAGLPKEIVTKLNAKIVELDKNEGFKKKLWAVNAIVPVQTPGEMLIQLEADFKAGSSSSRR